MKFVPDFGPAQVKEALQAHVNTVDTASLHQARERRCPVLVQVPRKLPDDHATVTRRIACRLPAGVAAMLVGWQLLLLPEKRDNGGAGRARPWS